MCGSREEIKDANAFWFDRRETRKAGKMLPDEVTMETESSYDGGNIKSLKKQNGEYPRSNGIAKEANGMLKESNGVTKDNKEDIDSEPKDKRESSSFTIQQLIWRNVIAIGLFHFIALYSYITFPYLQRPKTAIWGEFIII